MRPGRDDLRYRQNRTQLKRYDHTCHLCGNPIDLQLKHPHPWSWTCDHLIPTSSLPPGDPRFWHISNMRAAHRYCNLSRGAKPLTRPGLNTSRDY